MWNFLGKTPEQTAAKLENRHVIQHLPRTDPNDFFLLNAVREKSTETPNDTQSTQNLLRRILSETPGTADSDTMSVDRRQAGEVSGGGDLMEERSNAGDIAIRAGVSVEEATEANDERAASHSRLKRWYRHVLLRWLERNGYWYTTSFLIHVIGLILFAMAAMLLPDVVRYAMNYSQGSVSFDPVDGMDAGMPLERFSLERPLTLGGELDDSETPGGAVGLFDPETVDIDEDYIHGGAGPAIAFDGTEIPGGGFDSLVDGPGVRSEGSGGVGKQFGDGSGLFSGTGGSGYGLRGSGVPGGGFGGTNAAQSSVAGALWWLYRHQASDGHWCLDHTRQCRDGGCDQGSSYGSDVAATAMALLPFLGAGQTHTEKCQYQQVVSRGLKWLVRQQEANGRLAGADSPQTMYTHAIATTVLCEAYGMTQDPELREPAEKAIRFIEWAQHPRTGGWRYQPGEEGDLSVTAWQIMALNSGNMAGIFCNTENLIRSKKFLDLVADGSEHGLFQYQVYTEVTPGRTAMGLLCLQYLGERPDSRRYQEAKSYILQQYQNPNFFDENESYFSRSDVYSWYYITLVLHNTLDSDWDRWNRTIRKELIRTQCHEDNCAFGSWAPESKSGERDVWGAKGGRLMMTAFSALTLEIYYRYLPLFRMGVD